MARAVRKLRRAARKADNLPDTESRRARHTALLEFFTERSRFSFPYDVAEPGAQLLKIAEVDVNAAIDTFRDIAEIRKIKSTAVLSAQQLRDLLTLWLSGADPNRVRHQWATLDKVGVSTTDLIMPAENVPAHRIRPAVRAYFTPMLLAGIEIWSNVDPDKVAALALLGDRIDFTEGDWLCVAGDNALARGYATVAFSHYRRAEGEGCAAARQRRAQLGADLGYGSLVHGEARQALTAFHDALTEFPEPDIQLLAAIAKLLCQPHEASSVRTELNSLRGGEIPTDELDFWLAIADACASKPPHGDELALPAAVLIADDEKFVAENDDPKLDKLLHDKLAEMRAAVRDNQPVTTNRLMLPAIHRPPRPRERVFERL